jgi:glutamate dehydrogenase
MTGAAAPAPDDEPKVALQAVTAWIAAHAAAAHSAKHTLEEVERAPGGWSFAKLTIAHAALRELAGG